MCPCAGARPRERQCRARVVPASRGALPGPVRRTGDHEPGLPDPDTPLVTSWRHCTGEGIDLFDGRSAFRKTRFARWVALKLATTTPWKRPTGPPPRFFASAHSKDT